MDIFLFLAVVGNHADTLCKLRVIGHECAAVAEATQIFGWKEAGAADMANTACFDLAAVGEVVICSNSLGVVFDYK